MKNETIAQLIREAHRDFIELKTFKNSTSKNILNQLSRMCKSKNYYGGNCEDIVSQTFLNLFNSFSKQNKNSFWSSVIDNSEANDKRIIGYVYQMLLSSSNELEQDFWKKESINLNRAISEKIEELVSENKLIKNGKYFSLASNPKPINGYYVEFPDILFPVKNQNGMIDWAKVKDLILKIFEEYLEKYSISLSNIKEIIAKITNVGNTSLISIDEYNDDEEESHLIQLEDKNVSPDNYATAESFFNIWLDRAKIVFSQEDLEKRVRLYLLKYIKGYTLEKIAQVVELNIKKSSVENYIKKFIESMEIHKELNNRDPNINFYINSFNLFLAEKYSISVGLEQRR